jgi:hypothetical protein
VVARDGVGGSDQCWLLNIVNKITQQQQVQDLERQLSSSASQNQATAAFHQHQHRKHHQESHHHAQQQQQQVAYGFEPGAEGLLKETLHGYRNQVGVMCERDV